MSNIDRIRKYLTSNNFDEEGTCSFKFRGNPWIFTSRMQAQNRVSEGYIKLIHLGPFCFGISGSHYIKRNPN